MQSDRPKAVCLHDLQASLGAWVLALMDTRDLPEVAISALSQGLDNPYFRELAGLSSDTARGSELFERAVRALGWSIPDKRSAAQCYAVCVSKLMLTGVVSPYDGADALWRASLAVGDTSFHDLDPFIYWRSEYDERPADHELFDRAIVDAAKTWAARDPSGS